MGGDLENPTYAELGSNETGYIEVVKIDFDKSVVSYKELLNVFWECHDPTSWDAQAGNEGNLYRSVIFYYSDEQKVIAENEINSLKESKKYSNSIVTQVIEAKKFVRAKESDQHYYAKNK